MEIKPITLKQLVTLIGRSINVQPALKGVWTVAETSEVRSSGGHCYMELVEKNPLTGHPEARLRAVIWASVFSRLDKEFLRVTGSRIASDMQLMVNLTVTYHPVYGLSATVNDIDFDYTLGQRSRRRREILGRLDREGVSDMNKTLPWPRPVLRIAVISSGSAAGYGDFIHQLLDNRLNLNFRVALFPAVMQGKDTVPSIISALDRVASEASHFDCAVIIRGGGATTDLEAFDSYELALNVAQFPLPVITGIGHERDSTVLDFIAAISVKTPTAAAEWLIARGTEELERIATLASTVYNLSLSRLQNEHRRLDLAAGALPPLCEAKIKSAVSTLASLQSDVISAVRRKTERETLRLDSIATLLETLSPEATLRRGFSITRFDGKALSAACDTVPGQHIETILANGRLTSSIINIFSQDQ